MTIMTNKPEVTYKLVSHNTIQELKRRKKAYLMRIKSTPLPSTKILDYKYHDLFTNLSFVPLNQIYSDYYDKKTRLRRARLRNKARHHAPKI